MAYITIMRNNAEYIVKQTGCAVAKCPTHVIVESLYIQVNFESCQEYWKAEEFEARSNLRSTTGLTIQVTVVWYSYRRSDQHFL